VPIRKRQAYKTYGYIEPNRMTLESNIYEKLVSYTKAKPK